QERFIHLVRLAWELHATGLSAAVDLPKGGKPVVLVLRAKGPFRVEAAKYATGWFFTWGRRQDRRVRALDVNAFRRIWEVAR
ncbi:hypothetical protein, partial [Streptomyces anulatus]|uniref:hypothetical protein n=1 Tax=Streptomyces anulatus TaxID=1892 RepID=UPI0034401B42